MIVRAMAGAGALGAGLMYWFDPDRGRRRRARLRDKLVHGVHRGALAFDGALRDFDHRARGLVLRAKGRLGASVAEEDDELLAERVRAKLGRLTAHPRSIAVTCHGGRVRLDGDILEREAKDLISSVARTMGVRELEDSLRRHEAAEHIPALQGGREPSHPARDVWSPAYRLVVGSMGASLVVRGLARSGTSGRVALAAGTLLLVRSVLNHGPRRLFGLEGEPSLSLRKTFTIDAPHEDVFSFWMACENFPRFMKNIHDVRQVAEGRYHWRVRGPAGVDFDWEALVTEVEPNRLIRWITTTSSTIGNEGTVRFEPLGVRQTRVTLQMTLHVPAGWVGVQLAKVFGADPKREVEEDLVRLKSLIERGKATGRNGVVTWDELS